MKQHCPKASFFPKGKGRWHGVSRDGGIGNSSVRHSRPASSHRPALTLARCSVSSHRPRLRRRGVPALQTPFGRVLAPPAALRPSIAHCASLRVLATPALRASAARKLVCSSPCLTGVFVPACASLARYSGAADALWACPRPSTPSGLRRAYFALLRAQRALRAPLLRKGSLLDSATP